MLYSLQFGCKGTKKRCHGSPFKFFCHFLASLRQARPAFLRCLSPFLPLLLSKNKEKLGRMDFFMLLCEEDNNGYDDDKKLLFDVAGVGVLHGASCTGRLCGP